MNGERDNPDSTWDQIDTKLRRLYSSPKLKSDPNPGEEHQLISDVSDLFDILESGLTGARRRCPNGKRIPEG